MEPRSSVTKQNTINPVVGYKEKSHSLACPCCSRYVPDERNHAIYHDDTCSFKDYDQEQKEEYKLNGELLRIEDIYSVKKILKSGWLHKKGTGNDWIRSRAWKSRWACLVLASVVGYEIDVPILQIFWHRASTLPSSNILLDSSVIVPLNRSGEDENKIIVNKFCFDIVSTVTELDGGKVTRSFAVDDETERNQWSSALVKETADYGKRKKSIRIQRARSRVGLDVRKGVKKRPTLRDSLPPVSPPTSPSRRRMVLPTPAFSKIPRQNEDIRLRAFP
uniref:PH domain-containing protein n=1 Tax=Eucampia antarctica TaxID=49252 RepID=A0A7S2R0E6_9STRA|mmetsp:Transcript_11326/g.10841  ORF Transcript_11326/g.10841 Transcript_11326/m.10841 type:complete len:277 (+) Transcript_11326:94-924(+)|eukprot:CAMPEP_0197831950 /NCGR_PEP_ID=MMETSP1437-20131217/12868_1 /TAXON_ID=49252 ORGANISM="Eucampia antarctica, Strain CCMP1452" /NCGR_SAMPLE_ID=MMETSP1437 /ASSEMBLY_ACC=CAM_ASM_001096 /LENGTH=276 /DNA_ID=CAMNT_0043435103 /DNA_START=86 /DNA_END=916 /DNA_ORIENTATION=+